MRLKLFLFFILSFSFVSQSQNEAAIWYFGNNAGLDFNSGAPVVLTDGQLVTNEGCATISNSAGQLLFYTDGITVWDKTHNVMQNGTGLLGNPSSTQSGIIVPKPNDPDIYYIFTVGAQAEASGLNYSEVDMALNSGNGAITAIKNILLETPTTEKISAISHSNGTDIWVMSHGWENSDFLAYLVTPSGVNTTPVISSVGQTPQVDTNNAIGYLKFSPDGTKLASAKTNNQSYVELFDFDAATGLVSNPILLDSIFFQTEEGAYGLEFSPNSNILYVGDVNFNLNESKIHQFDVTFNNAVDIINSDTIIYQGDVFLGALQLAIDQKIYVSIGNSNFLGVIENPDTLGLGASYVDNAINLGTGMAVYGLPPFIQSFFNVGISTDDVCLGEVSSFSVNSTQVIDSILWDFGDGSTSTDLNPTHVYMTSGTFNVNVTVVSGSDSVDLSRDVVISEVPVANPISDYILCDDASNNMIEVFDLLTKDSEIIGGQSTTQLAVSYFLNQLDADNNENEISTNYTNTSNSQEVFARIFNVDNDDCYATTSFNLVVLQLPLANTVSDDILCDDALGDGVETLDLSLYDVDVLNGQSSITFNISYHLSQAEADSGSGDLPLNFQTITSSQVIFVRIENTFNPNCYDTTSFSVTIDDYFLPNQPNDLFLCDDESNDGIELFDLSALTNPIINGLAGNYEVSYHLSQEDADNDTNGISNNFENTSNPQEIFVRVEKTTNLLCYQTLSFFVEVKETPVLDIETTLYLCIGEELTLTADSGFDTYLWSTGQTTSSIIIDSGGVYTVTVGYNYSVNPMLSCTTTETITVIESDIAVFNSVEILDWSPNNNAIQIFAEGIGDYEYSIDGINYQDSPLFEGLEPGEYTVYVRDKFGCGIIEDEVYLLFYPYFFTPNNDGINDYWQIKFSDTEPDLDIKIFDRYGKWLTSLNPRGEGWDGTFNGKLLPASDYWFLVTRPSNGRQYKGHFSLKR